MDDGTEMNLVVPRPQSTNGSRSVVSAPVFEGDLAFRSAQSTGIENDCQNVSIYKTIAALRKSTLSISNRIKSVLQDAEYVESFWKQINNSCPLADVTWPLIPNERSGSWPLNPEFKQRSQRFYIKSSSPVSAYFKSTDGHINQWALSTRRLNLPVLDLLGTAGGAILIDTTRRGKSFPDALRRTVPIWCAVWNQILFPEDQNVSFQGFRMSDSEITQINARIPGFIEDLKGLDLELASLKAKLKRPVRCVWVNQPDLDSTTIFDDTESTIIDYQKQNVNILICLSASREVTGAEMSDGGYIQGAGDDSEGWSRGLTASIFWKHKEELLNEMATEDDLRILVDKLVKDDKSNSTGSPAVLIKPTSNIFIATGELKIGDFDFCVYCHSAPEQVAVKNCMQLRCKEGKLGSKQLREKLETVRYAVESVLKKDKDARIAVCCPTGRDLSVGVILMLLCCLYNDKGMNAL